MARYNFFKNFEYGSTSRAHIPLKVLIVDDSIIERNIHKFFLKRNNFQVVEVTDGTYAVDLHLEGEQFGIILMDDCMSVMDGAETVKKLREMGVRTVIIGVGHEEYKETLINAGVDKFVEKPILNMTELLQEFNLIA